MMMLMPPPTLSSQQNVKQDISTNLNLIMNSLLFFLPRCRFFRFVRFLCGCGTLSSENNNHRLVSNAFLRWNGIFLFFLLLFCSRCSGSCVCCHFAQETNTQNSIFYWQNRQKFAGALENLLRYEVIV